MRVDYVGNILGLYLRYDASSDEAFVEEVKKVVANITSVDDLNISEPGGHSALTWAVVRGHTEIAELLIEKNSKPSWETVGSAFINAVRYNRVGVVKLLLSGSFRADLISDLGDQAIHDSIVNKCGEVAKLLIMNNLNIMKLDSEPQSKPRTNALSLALESNQHGLAKFIIATRGNTHIMQRVDTMTLLRSNQVEAFKLLLGCSGAISILTKMGSIYVPNAPTVFSTVRSQEFEGEEYSQIKSYLNGIDDIAKKLPEPSYDQYLRCKMGRHQFAVIAQDLSEHMQFSADEIVHYVDNVMFQRFLLLGDESKKNLVSCLNQENRSVEEVVRNIGEVSKMIGGDNVVDPHLFRVDIANKVLDVAKSIFEQGLSKDSSFFRYTRILSPLLDPTLLESQVVDIASLSESCPTIKIRLTKSVSVDEGAAVPRSIYGGDSKTSHLALPDDTMKHIASYLSESPMTEDFLEMRELLDLYVQAGYRTKDTRQIVVEQRESSRESEVGDQASVSSLCRAVDDLDVSQETSFFR